MFRRQVSCITWEGRDGGCDGGGGGGGCGGGGDSEVKMKIVINIDCG